jgi:hypothetical protein
MSTEVQNYPPADTFAPEATEAPALVGFTAEFDNVDATMSAARKVRAAGYKVWDVHSPFPMHGIDAIIGIRPTILPWIVLCAGCTGTTCALLMQWWMNAFDYKLMISGKPFFSLPANVPIIFELTVLFSALTAVFGMLALNRLPSLYSPLFKSARFRRVTNDRFFILIDSADRQFDAVKTAEFLQTLNPLSVERVED